MRSTRVVNSDISSYIVYNTKSEEYLYANLVNNHVYWDTIVWIRLSDKEIKILDELLMGGAPSGSNTSLKAMIPVMQPEVEHLLIVPCIHFKKKRERVKPDFVNAFRFDGAE